MDAAVVPAQACTRILAAGGSGFLLELYLLIFELTTEKARPSVRMFQLEVPGTLGFTEGCGGSHQCKVGAFTHCPVPHPSHSTFNQAALLLSLLYAGILIQAALGKEREAKCLVLHTGSPQVRGPPKVTQ